MKVRDYEQLVMKTLVGYSKHEAQRRQTLGHQSMWYVVLLVPAGAGEDDDRSRRREVTSATR